MLYSGGEWNGNCKESDYVRILSGSVRMRRVFRFFIVKICAYADDTCVEVTVPAEDLTSERKGGFTGCTMGVYAEGFGTGYAKFTNTCLK